MLDVALQTSVMSLLLGVECMEVFVIIMIGISKESDDDTDDGYDDVSDLEGVHVIVAPTPERWSLSREEAALEIYLQFIHDKHLLDRS